MRKELTRVDVFLGTGQMTCSIHGIHNDWAIRDRREKRRNGFVYQILSCKRCERAHAITYNHKNPGYQNDYRFTRDGTISRILSQARNRAKKKHLPFELDCDWVEEQVEKQDNKCAYSGLGFDWGRIREKQKRYLLPSIDQRQAGVGYTKDNGVLVCAIVNRMKWTIPLEQFIDFCYAVNSYRVSI